MSTQGKTPQEWAEYLPEPIRTQFLENIDPSYFEYSERTDSLDDCILFAFDWEETKQTGGYWGEIHDHALNGEFSKPIEKVETPKPTEKMTAVEWLLEQIENKNGKEFAYYYSEFIDQAKAMEKKQITDCCIHTTQSCWTSLMDEIGKPLVFTDDDLKNQKSEAEQYYNETFGGDK